MNSQSLKVYFDGLCHLCSREIEHYRKMTGAARIHFVDITDPSFDAAEEGLDPERVHRLLHARDAEGKLHLGVGAFIQIWERIDSLRWLAALSRLAPVRWFLEAVYFLFAKARPWLPRKQCASSPYCEWRPR